MSLGVCILLVLFAVLMLLGVPVAFTLGVITMIAAVASSHTQPSTTTASEMANGVNSFTLLAIPFFILAGDLMGEGGLARRLIEFAQALVGRLKGGLGMVDTLACMFFGAISGSAAAAISSIGGALIPEMNKQGYGKSFTIALTTTSATTGLLIPPSNIMIVYAVAASVSIKDLFMAGVLPGVVIGVFIMVACRIIAGRRGYGLQTAAREETAHGRPLASLFSWLLVVLNAALAAFPALLLIVVVIGGILAGVFTATEASSVAVLWAFLLGVVCYPVVQIHRKDRPAAGPPFSVSVRVYREIPLAKLPSIVRRSARTTAVVLLLVASSSAMSQYLTVEQVPQAVSTLLLGLSKNPIYVLLTINVLLLVVGVFMDMTPAVLIFTPMLLPAAMELGIDPVHFGIIMIANLCIGLCTPPVGACLFVGCSVGDGDVAKVSLAMLPFYFAMVLGLMLITYIPAISLWLPSLLGD